MARKIAEKRLASKRASCWKEKFLTESILIEKEQSDDLEKLLDGISDDQLPENLKFLMVEQRKALMAKSPSGRRWHPKYEIVTFMA